MQRAFKILGGLLAVLILLGILLWAMGYGYIFRGLQVVYLKGHTTAYIDDHPQFSNRVVEAGENHQYWPEHKEYNSAQPTDGLMKINKDLGTVAYLIIKNDSIWYEEYGDGYNENSLTNSFSMAKSITTALLGKAIMDGYIKSLEQPVSDFFPEFSSPYNSSLTVSDLSSMASGLNWNEDYYNPFAHTARAYFDRNIRKMINDLEITSPPGQEFEYLSGNTLLLGMVLEKATGMTLSNYLSQSYWKPLGMQTDALWQLDSQESGLEKAYCCIASSARDFAKFGKLFKNHGQWNGNQLLDSSFVATATTRRFNDAQQYGYGFWLSDYREKDIFYMRGVLGQYVIVIPEDDLIIVRLGHKILKRDEEDDHSPDFFIYIDETYKMLDNASKNQS